MYTVARPTVIRNEAWPSHSIASMSIGGEG
jgi:hypothetical protein